MKILHVGWWITPYRYGGAINAALTLMDQQVKDGDEVYYFCGGSYNIFKLSPYIRKWKRHNITIYELVNSPNLVGQYGKPLQECHHYQIERQFIKVLSEVNPDVIQFHEFESLCGSLIGVAKSLGYPVVVFLRNYWPLCPQRDLLDSSGKICDDFNHGWKCIDCKVRSSVPKLGWMLLALARETKTWPLVELFLSHSKNIYEKLSSFPRPSTQDNISSSKAKEFLYRRVFFLTMLEKADRILAISSRTAEIYQSFGLSGAKVTVFPSVSKALYLIKPKKIGAWQPPITFGYIGGINYHKGVHILIEAFKGLPQDKARLLIFGKASNHSYMSLLRQKAWNTSIEFRGPYGLRDINKVLKEIDVGVVPSIWEEALGLVVLEFLRARIPVIASNIGGIPDYVHHRKDGLLVKPDNSSDLKEKMLYFIDRPERITSFQCRIKPLKFFDNYSNHMKKIYNLILLDRETSRS